MAGCSLRAWRAPPCLYGTDSERRTRDLFVPVALGILSIPMLHMAAVQAAARKHGSVEPAGAGTDRHGRKLYASDGRRRARDLRDKACPGRCRRAGHWGYCGDDALGCGLWWLLLAPLITVRYLRAEAPFNLGWWGYTFPICVYAIVTLRLGATLHLASFASQGRCCRLRYGC